MFSLGLKTLILVILNFIINIQIAKWAVFSVLIHWGNSGNIDINVKGLLRYHKDNIGSNTRCA